MEDLKTKSKHIRFPTRESLPSESDASALAASDPKPENWRDRLGLVLNL